MKKYCKNNATYMNDMQKNLKIANNSFSPREKTKLMFQLKECQNPQVTKKTNATPTPIKN
jgi:hypothetical protein